MTADETKSLKTIIKEGLKHVQGEISRLTTEVRGISSRVLHLYTETSKNGRETARLSSDIENMKDWLGEELGTINLKIDALISLAA